MNYLDVSMIFLDLLGFASIFQDSLGITSFSSLLGVQRCNYQKNLKCNVALQENTDYMLPAQLDP